MKFLVSYEGPSDTFEWHDYVLTRDGPGVILTEEEVADITRVRPRQLLEITPLKEPIARKARVTVEEAVITDQSDAIAAEPSTAREETDG